MEKSLFAVIRIVAMMISVDRKIHPKERDWFFAVMNNFGANFSQRMTLRKDLKGTSHKELEAVFNEIDDLADQVRLLNFLKVAMHVDGGVTPSEKEFFKRVKVLSETPAETLLMDYSALGKSLLEHEKKNRMWREIGEVGTIFSQRHYQFLLRANYMNYRDLVFIIEVITGFFKK